MSICRFVGRLNGVFFHLFSVYDVRVRMVVCKIQILFVYINSICIRLTEYATREYYMFIVRATECIVEVG